MFDCGHFLLCLLQFYLSTYLDTIRSCYVGKGLINWNRNTVIGLNIYSCLFFRPTNPPVAGLWKGALMSGKTGYFDPCNTVPFVEPKSSPDTSTPKKGIMRKGENFVMLVFLVTSADFSEPC